MKTVILAVMVISLMLAGVATAKVVPNLDQGTSQIGIAGSYNTDTAQGKQLTFGGEYLYSVWDNIQLGGVLSFANNDLSDTYTIGALGVYNFQTDSSWVPFLSLGVGFKSVEYDYIIDGSDAWIGTGGAGVKYFMTEDIALALSVNYSIAEKDLYPDSNGTLNDTNIQTLLGLQFYIN